MGAPPQLVARALPAVGRPDDSVPAPPTKTPNEVSGSGYGWASAIAKIADRAIPTARHVAAGQMRCATAWFSRAWAEQPSHREAGHTRRTGWRRPWQELLLSGWKQERRWLRMVRAESSASTTTCRTRNGTCTHSLPGLAQPCAWTSPRPRPPGSAQRRWQGRAARLVLPRPRSAVHPRLRLHAHRPAGRVEPARPAPAPVVLAGAEQASRRL